MKLRRIFSLLLALMMTVAMAGCSSQEEEAVADTASTETVESAEEMITTEVVEEETAGYAYGADVTFYSDEPVSYSMMFSDHEAYPYQDTWRIFEAITEKTNVTLDLTLIARTDYEDKKSVLVNTGDSPYIIPKTYDESAYVNGGQVVAVSDWVQYMPNYQKAVEEWGMASDLKSKLQADGKYYVLPGMWETAGDGYSFIIRKDIFEAAGVDVTGNEGNWTYEDFYEALKTVKAYTGSDYVLSDRHTAKSTINIAAKAYGVTAGWGIANGVKFNTESEQYEFVETSDNFKSYVTYFNKLVNEGLMDLESFSQDDETALAKFYRGESYVINGNYQNLADMSALMQVDDAELYMIVQPGGPAGMLQIENSRLENGVMIAQRALDELGEEEFIKMLRFIDWLWYSEEGHMLTLWGLEGETYTIEDGKVALDSDISYNGLNMDTATKKLNVDYGFGGGVFAYGGSYEIRSSKMTDGQLDFNNRIQEYRVMTPLDPPIMADEEQSEEMNLIKTPLMDYVDTMTMKFITGQADIDAEWDVYVAQCEALGSTRFEQYCNDIFADTKGILGY